MQEENLIINDQQFDENQKIEEQIKDEQKKEECTVATNPLKQDNSAGGNNRVTKTEALLMAIVLFLSILVGVSTIQYNGMSNKDEIIAEIADLKLQIHDLKSEITILENKLDDAEFDSQKPIDITIDFTQLEDAINGENITEEPVEQPTEETVFDESAFLGIGFIDVDVAANNPLGLKIDHVYDASPAASVGMKAGDIIISINGNAIKTYEDLDAVMATMQANETIEIYLASSSDTGIDFITVNPTLTYKGNFDLD